MLTHRHIEVFRAVMIAGSVTKAAELLGSSQPTVSRELARLEQGIGFALFDRVGGRLRPTMPGLALFDEVRQSYAGLERVASAAARLRAFKGGQLSVIALPAFSHSILPEAFRRFHERHGGVSLAVETQESPVLEEWLTAQRYDLGLTEHDAAPAGTRVELLLEVDEVCALPDTRSWRARGSSWRTSRDMPSSACLPATPTGSRSTRPLPKRACCGGPSSRRPPPCRSAPSCARGWAWPS